MKINDPVYRENEITNPVLIELINSQPLQRIKEVNQAGTQLVEPHKTSTRYDHCVGVLLLLKKFEAPIEEQIAGLLHDVPHTAFSHAADFVFKESETQTYHERFLRQIIFNSEIPAILSKYGFEPEIVVDESNFSLLEQPIPLLCADRIDYILRDLISDKVYSQKDVNEILENLTVVDNIFTMKNKEVALKFARDFMKQAFTYYNAPKTLAIFELMGELIRASFEQGVLTEEDLFTTDSKVLEKIKNSTNPKLDKILKILNPNLNIKLDNEDFDFETHGKARYIDPPVLVGNRSKNLTELVPEFKKEIFTFIEKTKKGYRVKLNQT